MVILFLFIWFLFKVLFFKKLMMFFGNFFSNSFNFVFNFRIFMLFMMGLIDFFLNLFLVELIFCFLVGGMEGVLVFIKVFDFNSMDLFIVMEIFFLICFYFILKNLFIFLVMSWM